MLIVAALLQAALLQAALALGAAAPPPARDARPEAAPTLEAGRRVTNWRGEAVRALHPAPLAWLAWIAPEDPAFAARCVRLNNYWCIKRAAWAGEIGADAEGHTAFADADAGADAAVALLRRYYVQYGRRTAQAIVRRWAPAECAGAGGLVRGGGPADALAVHGLGRTLRARFLAHRTRGGLPRARGRIQPYSALARLSGTPRRPPRPAGVRAIGAAPLARLAAAPATRVIDATGPALLPLDLGPALAVPPPLCASDSVRIANYAARIGASAGRGPDDDLHLFDPAGRPLPALEPVLVAMSAVELGTFRAQPALVAAAIARATPP